MTNTNTSLNEVFKCSLNGKSAGTLLLPYPILISNLIVEVSWIVDEVKRPFSLRIDYFETKKKFERIFYIVKNHQNGKVIIGMPMNGKVNNLLCRYIELRLAGQQALFLTNFYIRLEDSSVFKMLE